MAKTTGLIFHCSTLLQPKRYLLSYCCLFNAFFLDLPHDILFCVPFVFLLNICFFTMEITSIRMVSWQLSGTATDLLIKQTNRAGSTPNPNTFFEVFGLIYSTAAKISLTFDQSLDSRYAFKIFFNP